MYLIYPQGLVIPITSVRFFLLFAAFLPHVLSFVGELNCFFWQSRYKKRFKYAFYAFARLFFVPLGKHKALHPTCPPSQHVAPLKQRGMVRETQSLGQQLSTLPRHKIAALETALYPRETHASSLMPAINDGLKWLFARCKADAQCHT